MTTLTGKTQSDLDSEAIQSQVLEIKNQLLILDITISRSVEDLYSYTNSTPYKSVQDVIDKKMALRKQLKELEG